MLQVLRAIAALMVVAHHSTILVEERLRPGFGIWTQGASGVDIFFVLSGLVMMLSTASLHRRGPRAAVNFLKRRFERIVPLYWLMTTVKLVGLALLPALAVNAIGSGCHVLASYLFLPSVGPTHTLEPLLIVGWTLNLEMVFYVLFALALALGLPAAVTIVPSLIALAALRYAHLTLPWVVFAWSDPVVLDFLYGLLLGHLVLRGLRLTLLTSALLFIGGFVALALTPSGLLSAFRPILWGLPAAAVVAGAVGLEPWVRDRIPYTAVALGDASYSVYLTHGFLLPVLGVALVAMRTSPRLMSVVAILAALPLSAAVGWGTFRVVELPLLRRFGLRRRSAEPALPA